MTKLRTSLRIGPLTVATTLAAFGCRAATAEEPPSRKAPPVHWQDGPGKAGLGSRAEIELPPSYRFAGGSDTRKLLESMGNIASGAELGFVTPPGGEWFVIFDFNDSGYVKDDDKDKLDADKILE